VSVPHGAGLASLRGELRRLSVHELWRCTTKPRFLALLGMTRTFGETYERQMRCWLSREENITGSWWTLVAWRLMAVAAWVRRLPSRASKSRVLTWWAQWEQVNFMPPLTRAML